MTAPSEEAALGSDPAGGEALSANKLGIAGIVFFVVAAAAPLVGMTGAVPVAIGLGNGSGAPGAYLVAGIVLLIFSVGYSTMSHEVSNAGAFFAYVGRGLGSIAGVGSAFVSLVGYLAVQLAIYGFFGSVCATQLNDKLNTHLHWWVWCLIAWAIVGVLSILQVDIGAKVLGVLMGTEVLSLFVTAIAVIIQGGGKDGLHFGASFAPSHIFAGGLTGGAGIALAFAFASFIGFEATAIYAEETKNPKRAVPIATYTAIILIAALFAITSWAIVSGIGSSDSVGNVMKISHNLADPAEVVYSVAREFVGGWLATLMSWLVLSSLFAGLLAFQNSAARYFFSLGRARVLPRALDKVNRHGAPINGAIATSVIAGIVIVIFAAAHLDPYLKMFSWFSSMTVLAILLVEALVSLSVIVYFRNRPHWWKTVLAPLLSIVGLIGAFYLVMSRFGLLAGTVAKGVDPTSQTFGLSALGWLLVLIPVISLVIGLVVGAVRRTSESSDGLADFR